jgi:G:T-mismatch repair DNA endonuclease (very short patch repair protein)
MILCPFCNKEFINRKSFSNHLTRTHGNEFVSDVEKEKILVCTLYGEEIVETTVKEYIDGLFSVHGLPIDIAKYLSLLGVKRTSKEERKTERYKQTYLTGIQKKYGNDITNISQVKEIQNKKEKTCESKHGSYQNYLDEHRKFMKDGYVNYVGSDKHIIAVEKQRKTCEDRFGNGNFGCGDDAIKKSKRTRKETIESWDYEERLERTRIAREAVTHRGGFTSKPEKRIRKILIDLDVEAKYNVFLFKYNWDLVIEDIIIEVQGVMWHGKPDRYNADDLIMGKILVKDIWEKDARKQNKAREEGYKVIEIWEDEISKKSDNELLVLVKNRLLENGYKF